ncbi:MAG TPA: response regulator transcription factor [Thermoanaerobaculia bacterium]|jgi:DNA-binding NarL/FixJ family response regulator|nr:response regulator transcription factor [Thermoanaerobaculia bacterium]
MQPSIVVVILSSDRLFREVVSASLSWCEDLEAIAAPDGAASLDLQSAPGIVLIDASFNLPAALAQTWEVRAQWPDAKIIAVGLDEEDEQIVDFAEAGALGYVLKGATLDELVETIQRVQRGETLCSPRILAAVVARITSLSRLGTEPPPQVETLTARELEILALVAAGLSNKEVGRRLRITLQTVKNHVHRILEKLQCHRRREAVRLAYDLGLLQEPREAPPSLWSRELAKGDKGVDPF